MIRIPRTLALALTCTALIACQKSQPPAAPPPPEVGIIQVQPQAVPLTRDLVGRLSPFRSADVRARVAGVLVKRVYAEGSDVKEGDVLFEIDPAPLKATLASAQAGLTQAQAAAANAKAAANRARELIGKNYVSRSDLDNAEATERTTAAQVQQARAEVQTAQINLGYATVRAPISGRAGQQQVTEGALVGQGTATLLTTIDQLDPVYANFTLSVSDLDQLREAASHGAITLLEPNKAEVALTRQDGTPTGRNGVLDFSDVTVDPATGSVALRAQIANPDRTLLPGMYVTGSLSLGQINQAFLIPQSVLQRDAQGAYVLVVGEGDKVERRPVKADTLRKDAWIVTDGIKAGERLVADGIQKARPGQPVKPVATADAGAKPAQG
ncbi:efflux RND transporter periplasmic adaptor subunit [Dokdonella koreensis]|uniref:RND efflux system, membrane fusion protein CmeA n=1 Tax=Dokdonella koreensis DS-123 TaxID=1300342 RepID=A0A160DW44_9GAMM|nr:efflux RND transporter periplasmic adaptor subunit [Dokdonella koreensis]ANB18073.1 RND efflux system, membrane fusion protein CmeA [Dokdonella koreensis DS-123]